MTGLKKRSGALKFCLGLVLVVSAVAWPLIVYGGIGRINPLILVGFLVVLLGVRLLKGGIFPLWMWGLVIVGVMALTFFKADYGLLYYPVLIDGLLLVVFALSLLFGPPVIERFARLKHPDLPASGVRWTRRVTWVWCGFFLINGTIAYITTTLESTYWWSLYNGCLSYIFMGVLFVGEVCVRRIYKIGQEK